MAYLTFPKIDPVALSLGVFQIRWYALAYLAGFIGGWRYGGSIAELEEGRPNRADIDDLLPLLVLGVILGGRLGYVLFYNADFFWHHPLQIPAVWEGGMSFHGGLLGVAVVCVAYARHQNISLFRLSDILSAVAPIGLFFGRLANFINGELFGRITHVPWAMVFPNGGPFPRHPSQLYEAALEGLFLFSLMFILSRMPAIRRRAGTLTGVFLTAYGICRFIAEFLREPDPQIGFIYQYLSLGQLLSLPMMFAGIAILYFAKRHSNVKGAM